MPWLNLIFLSTIFVAVSNILQKVLVKDKDSDPISTSFIFQIVVALIFGLYTYLFKEIIFPPLQPLLLNLFLVGLLYFIFSISVFKAFKAAHASDVSIILSMRAAWVFVGSVLFLGDSVTFSKFIGVLFVIFGAVVIDYTQKIRELNEPRRTNVRSLFLPLYYLGKNKGYVFALIASISLGLALTNDAYILSTGFDLYTYLPFSFLLPSFVVFLYKPSVIKVVYSYSLKTWITTFITAFIYGLGVLALFESFLAGGEFSVINPIQQTSLILTVFLGYMFLNETSRLKNKLVGSVFMLLGVIFLS